MSSNNIIKSLYNFVVFLNIFLLFIFIILNFNHLDAIDYAFSISGTDYDFEVNFYAFLVLIGIIFILVILSSISILGSGINEFGTTNIAKYISILAFVALFGLTTSYFILPFGYFGILIELFFIVIYFLNALSVLPENGSSL